MTRAQKRQYSKIGCTLVILILTVVLILPFLWMISTSFKEADEIFLEIPKWLPSEFSFKNYGEIWNRGYFPDCCHVCRIWNFAFSLSWQNLFFCSTDCSADVSFYASFNSNVYDYE